MQYVTKKLDGRYSHKKYFKYFLEFKKEREGPLQFHIATKWMMDIYGYTAEIRDWQYILESHKQHLIWNLTNEDTPSMVNYSWSWANSYNERRIYVKGDKELAFFRLKWPIQSRV